MTRSIHNQLETSIGCLACNREQRDEIGLQANAAGWLVRQANALADDRRACGEMATVMAGMLETGDFTAADRAAMERLRDRMRREAEA